MNTSLGSSVPPIVPAVAVRRPQSGEPGHAVHRATGSCVAVFVAVAGVFLACAAPVSHAANVPKGRLMVRSGAANTDANYAKEDRDPNGKLQHVSALCSPGHMDAAALVATDHTRQWSNYMQGNATTVVKLGGNVVEDPLPNNPNHCLIDGLSVGQIKGVWH